ncbi:hypothetical protein AB0B13_28535, partial [Streptomyces sp. NPDC042898]
GGEPPDVLEVEVAEHHRALGGELRAPAGFFAQGGGYEYPAFLGFTAAAIGIAGAGRYSLDHATCHVVDRPWVVATAFIGSALAAAAVVGRRAQEQASPEDEEPADAAPGEER